MYACFHCVGTVDVSSDTLITSAIGPQKTGAASLRNQAGSLSSLSFKRICTIQNFTNRCLLYFTYKLKIQLVKPYQFDDLLQDKFNVYRDWLAILTDWNRERMTRQHDCFEITLIWRALNICTKQRRQTQKSNASQSQLCRHFHHFATFLQFR